MRRLLAVCGIWLVLGSVPAAFAYPTSTNYELVSDGLVSGGETGGVGQARVAGSVIGEPISNDVAAAGVYLSEGHFVVQQLLNLSLPHQAPTINAVITPTATSTQTVAGTKAPNTSVWINGSQVVAMNGSVSWGTVVNLAEGTNVINVLTKDVNNNSSATITTAIVLDTSPPTVPVVTDDGVYTTNLTQLHAQWSSTDPGTGIGEFEYRIGTTSTGGEIVAATSVAATVTAITKTGLTLTQGQVYYLGVRAKNGAGLWSDWGVSDGIYANASVPTISTLTPADASKSVAGAMVTLSLLASDADGDALEYQFSANGIVKQAWSSAAAFNWQTTSADIGLTMIKGEVRDGHGGSAQLQQEIYVVRPPIAPPS